jgi:hypothetical protein
MYPIGSGRNDTATNSSRCWRHATTGDFLPGSPQFYEFATNIKFADEPTSGRPLTGRAANIAMDQ